MIDFTTYVTQLTTALADKTLDSVTRTAGSNALSDLQAKGKAYAAFRTANPLEARSGDSSIIAERDARLSAISKAIIWGTAHWNSKQTGASTPSLAPVVAFSTDPGTLLSQLDALMAMRNATDSAANDPQLKMFVGSRRDELVRLRDLSPGNAPSEETGAEVDALMASIATARAFLGSVAGKLV